MNLKQIENVLRGIKAKPIVDGTNFSVLVPLIEINNELNLIFEVRSMSIKRQPGEISFPGGKIEDGESPLEAAVRETTEEIGIEKENIKIIAELDYASHKEGAFVYSYLGYIKDIVHTNIKFSKDEVSELFYVPLSFFLENEPERYFVNYHPEAEENFPFHMIIQGNNYKWDKIKYPVYFYKYNDYIIWGLTAKIAYNFIKKIKT
ncbi:mutator protein MutT [Sedimentibacter acidaminivorans]|uniref:Mutator protein MutT n=1 Tax=Sedimentibacter acidaminivorans TaxID=913099 RepID=A0ABS4GGF0_9FIRM|nr:CoA pyrophosphatase [Sedimentibacter acidaminivorans]MBP1926607.1 mutator protein MutT [Sedimentibacter acidaminivorans]